MAALRHSAGAAQVRVSWAKVARAGFDCARCVWPLLVCAWAANAHAHIASNGFLTLNVEGSTITGTIELAMRDGELAIGLDSNRDGKINWGEVGHTTRPRALSAKQALDQR